MHHNYLIKGFTLLDRQNSHVIEEILDKKFESQIYKVLGVIKLNQRMEPHFELKSEQLMITASPLDKQQGQDSSYIGVLITDPQFPQLRAENLLDEILLLIKKNDYKIGKEDGDKQQQLEIKIARTLIHWNDSNKRDLVMKDERMKKIDRILLFEGSFALIITFILGFFIVYHK